MKSALKTATTIDVHAHVVLADSMNAAGHYGPEIGQDEQGKPWFRIGDYYLHGVQYQGSAFMDVDVRVQRMDLAGIDVQVLSPNPLTYFHFIDKVDAVRLCQSHNDALRQHINQHPNRLAGVAALPMQDIGAACEELERAITELSLLGGYIGTDIGRHLDDPALDRFYKKCVDLNVPLFIHPSPAGIDGPSGDANLKQYDLDIICGFAAQETIAVATLIYGGVLHRHPNLDICFNHGGGAVPMLIGRLNQAARLRPWAPEYLRGDGEFEQFLSKIWFDTHVNDQRVLDFVVQILGKDHLLFGTNFAGWDQHETHSDAEWNLQLADNARRLLRV